MQVNFAPWREQVWHVVGRRCRVPSEAAIRPSVWHCWLATQVRGEGGRKGREKGARESLYIPHTVVHRRKGHKAGGW